MSRMPAPGELADGWAELDGWPEVFEQAAARLGNRREAQWMVEEAAGERLSALTAAGPAGAAGAVGGPSQKARLRMAAMVERRLAGEPLQYVLGNWSFRTLELMVDRRVLIPRPETEQVVEVALGELDRIAAGRAAGRVAFEVRQGHHDTPLEALAAELRTAGDRLTAVDLGTGSGAIAMSIAAERRGVEVWATDVSHDAVAVASANVAGCASRWVTVAQGDWWEALPADLRGRIDLVVSNPPYISTGEMAGLDAEVRDWEPNGALESGPSGTEAVEAILAGAARWLRPGGAVVVEIAPHQADGMVAAAKAAGFADVRAEPDLAGRPRALVARLVSVGESSQPDLGKLANRRANKGGVRVHDTRAR